MVYVPKLMHPIPHTFCHSAEMQLLLLLALAIPIGDLRHTARDLILAVLLLNQCSVLIFLKSVTSSSFVLVVGCCSIGRDSCGGRFGRPNRLVALVELMAYY